MNRTSRVSFFIYAFALLLLIPVAAFSQGTTSSIRGNVFDHTGAPVAGAQVVVEDLRTSSSRAFTANDRGVFLATNLAVGGPYMVTVSGAEPIVVDAIRLDDIYNISIRLEEPGDLEEVVVTGQSTSVVDVAAGPAATFSNYELDTAVSFNRDIVEAYTIDPRVNLDNEDDGYAVNCAGKHPRFNSVTLDGVSQNDRFGLNENGYSTAVGMPFPYDAIQQVAVELAPFDVTYGGFSACNINAVTKTGTNEWTGGVFAEWTSDDLRGDSLKIDDETQSLSTPPYNSNKRGFYFGGPLMKDRLFLFAAYEESDSPRFLAQGYAGSGSGVERDFLSEADYNRINSIAQNIYNYDPGGQPGDGSQEADKYMVRLDWNISDDHNLAFIYNYFDGFQLRDSDGGSNEFEFANHFYTKGAESETITAKLASQWTDTFSTELFISNNEMNDSQVTVGPKDFGDHQISINRDTVYLGADDSRQANALNTESDFYKITGQYLAGDHVITVGFESEELHIFNQFVQHANGGEWDYFDDSVGNPAHCAALTAQGRFEDPDCEMSGIDKFELGRPSRVYYGSGGGTNDPADAAASFKNTLNSFYVQDEVYFDDRDLTIVYGLRYDWFDSSDRPVFNQAFADANGGLRNDHNIDGIDILMPRFGFTWGATDTLTVRGGLGLYSGGNPNVWLSNAWSNDGFSNVQVQLGNFNGAGSVLDGSIPLSGQGRPGYDVPQELVDRVAAATIDNASTSRLVLIDPNYEQPSEWKMALGATWETPWMGITADMDILLSRSNDAAQYVDLSQSIVGMTSAGMPIYNYTNGRDNFMLTNSPYHANSATYSVVLNKGFESGWEVTFGYAYSDAEDIVPMTSAVAGSNWDNVALNDVNNPRPATSNYLVPHRLTLRASYGTEFFSDLETRFTFYGYSAEGQPQSYVMGSSDLEGDGFFGRHLLYVPDGANDPNVVFEPGFDQAAFNAFVAAEGLSPGFQARNGQHAKWSTRFDFRVDQEIPFFGDMKGRLFLKIYNLGNMLNDEWGHVNDAQFFSVQAVNSTVNDDGQYVFERFNNRTIEDLLEQRSLWEARLGLQFDF